MPPITIPFALTTLSKVIKNIYEPASKKPLKSYLINSYN